MAGTGGCQGAPGWGAALHGDGAALLQNGVLSFGLRLKDAGLSLFGTVTQPLSLLQHRIQECSDLSRDELTAEITQRGTVNCKFNACLP